MAVDILQDWKDTLAALPKVADTSWAATFAEWYADRVINIETSPALDTTTGFTFPFAEAVFAAALIALTPTTDALAGITGFANAWESAILLTIPTVAPGAFIPPSTPATLFSVVTGTIIDPASTALGKAKIIELASASPVPDPQDSEFPVKFRDATLLLTITVTGLNSVSPTPGPLVAAAVPLL